MSAGTNDTTTSGRRGVVVGLMLFVLAGGCGGRGGGDVVVFAASSLGPAFADIAVAYEAETGEGVELNLAGSSRLREQILGGAPADVFASASLEHVEAVSGANSGGRAPVVFATNQLVVAVPRGNPAGVVSLQSLGRAELLVGLCAPQVPCGAYANQLLAAHGIDALPDTLEADARSLVTKLEARELDVGVVYETDVRGSADLELAPQQVETGVVASYPILDITGDAASSGFVAFVLGPRGREVLAEYGFGTP